MDPQEEMDRVLPLLQKVRQELPANTVVSIDTSSAKVAREALKNGADWINDVTGGRDPDMIRTIADALADPSCVRGASYVAMHMRGTPQTMDGLTQYDDVVAEVGDFLTDRINSISSFHFLTNIFSLGVYSTCFLYGICRFHAGWHS